MARSFTLQRSFLNMTGEVFGDLAAKYLAADLWRSRFNLERFAISPVGAGIRRK